jgi:ER-bound oxygenase mpaB/B'/Rubber oxygenase, catalytic domain
MPSSPVLDEIRRLDPERDHQRVVLLSTRCDFPFDTTRSLEFALFRTFCVPSIARLLDQTKEFEHRAQRRYDDTDILVSELLESGYDSERGRAALRRINQLHGRFDIANDDFLYVLSTFVYEPIRWNARYGWRPLCEQERLALFFFWREVGRRMNIKELPADYQSFEEFNVAYERRHFRYDDCNQRVGRATLEMFASWFPRPLRPLVRQALYAVMDEPVRAGFGFPRPHALFGWLVPAGLRLRARALRWLLRRRRPLLRTAMKHRSHPSGYRIEQLGPPAGA